jgi:hypothetical protein
MAGARRKGGMAMRRTFAVLVVLAACEVLAGATDTRPDVGPRNYVDGYGHNWVQRAIETAVKRLHKPKCERVLEEFSDVAGVPLSAKLKNLGVTPEEYLTKWIRFLDGSRERRCLVKNVAAFTETGSHVVYVCSYRVATNHVAQGEIVIIHEMLHSLGLGENPPTASQITDRVLQRCGT